jgi:hypothetical protein
MTVGSIRTALILHSNETLSIEQAAASAGVSCAQFEALTGNRV